MIMTNPQSTIIALATFVIHGLSQPIDLPNCFFAYRIIYCCKSTLYLLSKILTSTNTVIMAVAQKISTLSIGFWVIFR